MADFLCLERDPCYGTCPVYKIWVHPSGLVTFDGYYWIEKNGKRERKTRFATKTISKKKIQKLVPLFQQLGEFEDRFSYENCEQKATDMATVRTLASWANKVTFSDHYTGCTLGNELSSIEDEIDKIIQTESFFIH